MTESRLEFIKKHITQSDIKDKLVLEVGSRNINGSAREFIETLQPAKYIGVDITEGPGVDDIVSAYELVKKYGRAYYDVVICTETLEHLRLWKLAVLNMYTVLKHGGLLIITTPPKGMKYHGWPNDYWRFTEADYRFIFPDAVVEGTCMIKTKDGVIHLNRKIYSVLRGWPIRHVTPIDDLLKYVRIAPKTFRKTAIKLYHYVRQRFCFRFRFFLQERTPVKKQEM
jgi:SAM-dependent methyltransferase